MNKKYQFISLLVFSIFCFSTIVLGTSVRNDGKYHLSDWSSPSLYNALAELNPLNSDVVLVIDKNDSLTQSETVDKEITLEFIPGNIITIPSAYTFTVNGPVSAGLIQIFTNFGTVTFGGGGNIKMAYPQWWGAKGDWNGSTGTNCLNAFNDAFSSGAKAFSISAGSYYIGTSGGITIPYGVGVVNGAGKDRTKIFYAGSGVAVTENNAVAAVSNLTVEVSDNAAIGISFVNACRKASLTDVYVTNSVNSSSNTGTGILLDGTGGWIGGIDFDNIQVQGFKYGIETIGTSSSNTVTCITGKNVWLVGRSAGVVTGSCGIYMDTYTNGVGSIIIGGTIECFAKGIKIENGAANGFGHGIGYVGDFEDNTTNWEVGNAFTGEIRDLNCGGYIRQFTNGTANIWTLDKYTPGNIRSTFNRYSQYFDFFLNGSVSKWGARDSVDSSDMGGFAFAGTGNVSPEKNYIYQHHHKITWHTAAPTLGTWTKGDRCFNSNPSVGNPKGWICTVAGTPGTWVSEGNL